MPEGFLDTFYVDCASDHANHDWPSNKQISAYSSQTVAPAKSLAASRGSFDRVGCLGGSVGLPDLGVSDTYSPGF
jgi:hypothetical protein